MNDDPRKTIPRQRQLLDNRYELLESLGKGAMGVVHRGRHVVLDKPVAIKRLTYMANEHPKVYERFLREARAAAQIQHPNICDATDFGLDEQGQAYMVMELLDGQTLKALIDEQGKLDEARAVSIVVQITSALGAAHAHGVVHRDLKPDNLFLISRQGQADFIKVLDFGLAGIESDEDSTRLTRSGAVLGTPTYMAPEQAMGERSDHRADLYSLGVLLYELLSGHPPFTARSIMKVLAQQIHTPPPPLRGVRPRLAAIVNRLLSKKPSARFPDAASLMQAFQALNLRLNPHARAAVAAIELLPPPAPPEVFDDRNRALSSTFEAFVISPNSSRAYLSLDLARAPDSSLELAPMIPAQGSLPSLPPDSPNATQQALPSVGSRARALRRSQRSPASPPPSIDLLAASPDIDLLSNDEPIIDLLSDDMPSVEFLPHSSPRPPSDPSTPGVTRRSVHDVVAAPKARPVTPAPTLPQAPRKRTAIDSARFKKRALRLSLLLFIIAIVLRLAFFGVPEALKPLGRRDPARPRRRPPARAQPPSAQNDIVMDGAKRRSYRGRMA